MPMLGNLGSKLGPCWASSGWRLSGLKFQPQRKHGSVEVEFWVGFGLMLGHLEALLGLCWAILGLCWALLAAFGPKKKNRRKIFLSWVFLGRFWAYVGPFGGFVGPLLGHFRAMLGSVGGFRA